MSVIAIESIENCLKYITVFVIQVVVIDLIYSSQLSPLLIFILPS